jgi:SSS family solute:Na+ symporter
LIVAVIASYFGKPRYYGEASWERVPNGNNRSDVKLEKIDFEILTLMRLGHQYMADITDSLGVDSKISGAAVERLDRGGYLMRMGLKGSNFFTFELTEKGQKALEPLNDHDTQLSAQFLSPMYLELLKTVEKNPEHQAAFVQKNGIASMQMAAISSHLTRRGYIEEKGLFKRKLIITPKGRKVIEQFSKA